jgi:hypothetical protein
MRAVWIGVVCALAIGCSEDKQAATGSSPDGGAGGGAGSGGKGSGGAPAANTSKLHWQVTELAASPTTPPPAIEGVDICVHEHAEIPCVKTDKDGFFDLAGLPRDTALNITFKKTGYVPTLKSIETSNTDMDATGNPPINMIAEGTPPTDFGFTVDVTKGILSFFVIGPAEAGFGPLPGSTATLSPKAGNGPIYFGEEPNSYDVNAKATYSFGGNFYNLDEGDYKVTFAAPPGNDCAGISFPFSGWGVPVSGEPAVTAKVLPGHVTWQVGNFCTVALPGGDAGKDAATPSGDAGKDAAAKD